jgi:hypothetical protein
MNKEQMSEESIYLLNEQLTSYYDNIDYNKLFKMLVTVFTKPITIYGLISFTKCNISSNKLSNLNDIEFYSIKLSRFEIHDYLYHNIDYSLTIKKELYSKRDIIVSLYYKYLRRITG